MRVNNSSKLAENNVRAIMLNNTTKRIRERRFGLYSYYDTVTNETDTNALIDFINTYNIAFVNQYACYSYTPTDFAGFVDKIRLNTNATVHVLFDDTLSTHPSPCDRKCQRGSSSGTGWCCGSVDLKLKWLAQVLGALSDPSSLDGANFDIEGMDDGDYMDLFRTLRKVWNDVIHENYATQLLRFNFGNLQQELAAQALSEKVLDRIYWEAYESNEGSFLNSAVSILSSIQILAPHSSYSKGSRQGKENSNLGRVLLAFETNCCAQPCADPACYSCGTHPLPHREEKSFGYCNTGFAANHSARGLREITNTSFAPPHTDDHHGIVYLLDVLEEIESKLKQLKLLKYVDQDNTHGFVAYNYRGFHILLDGKDADTHVCPGAT